MDPAFYRRHSDIEDRHWWFMVRRQILRDAIQALPLPPAAQVLEVGCGTGGNLSMLRSFGEVRAMEMDAGARAFAEKKSGLQVAIGYLPDAFPFATERFDLIGAFDVIEHIEDDHAALVALREALAPGGHLVLSVPALPRMWSYHDEHNHHFRRYTRATLRSGLSAAGFEVEACRYFNCLLLPLAYAVRKRYGRNSPNAEEAPDFTIPKRPINATMRAIFSLERPFLRLTGFPLGLSLLAVARTPSIPSPS